MAYNPDMEAITVQLPDEVAGRLRQLADQEHRAVEETIGEILRRRLTLNRFHDLCRASEPLARAAGYQSEDELLRDIA